MSARITVNCCRKIGRPKFSSASAGLSIEFDVAGDLSPEIRAAMIDSAFDECWAAVAGELAELTSDDDDRTDKPEPEPEPEPSRNGRRPDDYDESSDHRRPGRGENRWGDGRGTRDAREPRRRDDRDDDRRPSREPERRSSRAPRTGKELFGWLKDQEKDGADGIFRAIARWGKSVGYPEQFADWTPDEVADGYDEARHWMARRNGDDR